MSALLLLAAGSTGVPNAGTPGDYTDNDEFGAGSASVVLSILNDGTANIAGGNFGPLSAWNWITPTAIAGSSGWTVRLNVNSGTVDSGSATATDLAVTTSRSWTVSRTLAGGTDSANVTLVIKDSGGNTIASATYNLHATRP